VKSFEEHLTERTKASPATKAKLMKPLDKKMASGMKLQVKNIISDLDNMAWKLENQVDIPDSRRNFLVGEIDKVMKDAKTLQSTFKKVLKP
tara:strand:- start:12240 stop:12512 length:273 start_codon:yes stop_codon:yes gene_type:complete